MDGDLIKVGESKLKKKTGAMHAMRLCIVLSKMTF